MVLTVNVVILTSFTILFGDLEGILALTSDLLLDFVSLVLGLLSWKQKENMSKSGKYFSIFK